MHVLPVNENFRSNWVYLLIFGMYEQISMNIHGQWTYQQKSVYNNILNDNETELVITKWTASNLNRLSNNWVTTLLNIRALYKTNMSNNNK